mgnify:FL=1|tara:strand:- start:150 stop:671 length:522 start_codon:yes stop_codon:yes gene_type:complete
MEQIIELLSSLRSGAESLPQGKNLVAMIEKRSGIAIEHLLAGVLLFCCVCIFCTIKASLITNMIGFVYPSFCTIQAIESPEKKDDTEWLIYWVVFSTFHIFDPLVESFVIHWLPFFYPLKVCFLLWCFLPNYKGANQVYRLALPTLELLGLGSEQKDSGRSSGVSGKGNKKED